MKIAYLVQDLADTAVEKRVRMLRRGGAEVDLYGFRREGGAPAQVGGVTPHELGQTLHNKLGRRGFSLVRHGATVGAWARGMADADLILARNLDNLFLAALARRWLGLKIPLVYELLDIHTIMIKDHPISRLLRAFEGGLLRASDAVIVSSPAFDREYLTRYHQDRPELLLVENKVFNEIETPVHPALLGDGPPWRIGWFGGIRCKRSWDCLVSLIKADPGLFEVHIRGRFINPEMGDVYTVIRDTPGMFYHGPYKAPEDLARIYGEVHFTWAIDFCQEDANSDWLLPNRLYEGGAHGAAPIALRTVETGRWLEQRGLGLLVDAPLEESVRQLLRTMTAQAYRNAAGALRSADPSLFQWTGGECKELVDQLVAIGAATAAPAR